MKKKTIVVEIIEIFIHYIAGKTPLKISFWGIYIFGWNIVTAYVFMLLLSRLGLERSTIELLTYPITTILGIGVWNSASIFKGKKIWAVLAKIIVGIQIFAVLVNLVAFIFGIDLANL